MFNYRHVMASIAILAFTNPAIAIAAPRSHKVAVQQTAAQGKLNLNTATGKELVKIKGLTPGKARAIVAYRKRHGNFTSLEDLVKVKAVSKLNPEEVKQVKAQLTI